MIDNLGRALAGVLIAAAAIVMLYGAYWAFTIRRALVGRIYRNHALWLGVLCLIIAFLILMPPNPFWLSTDNFVINLLSNATWPNLVLFAFVDSTIPVARRSDPLFRRILHWDKVRIVIWIVLAFDFVLSIITNLASSIPGFVGYYAIDYALTLVALVTGAVAILIGARRSRDSVFRRSLKWLGLALLSLLGFLSLVFLEFAIGLSDYDVFASYGTLPLMAFAILMGYALYRSARSLAPLNRLTPNEMTPAKVEAI